MSYGTAATRAFSVFSLLLATCVLQLSIEADSINTQVSCYTAGQPTVTGSNSCSVQGSEGYANDQLQLTVSSPASTSDYTTISLSENGVAHYATGSYYNGDNSVFSSASLDLTFTTAGPERPGYLEVSTPSSLDTEWGLAQLGYSIGPQSGGCSMHTVDCSFGSTPPVSSLLPNRFFNFTLGDPFSVDLAYNDAFGTEEDSAITPISGIFELQFRFFESDAITPVAISPEPATLPLIAVSLVVAGLGLRFRARRLLRVEVREKAQQC